MDKDLDNIIDGAFEQYDKDAAESAKQTEKPTESGDADMLNRLNEADTEADKDTIDDVMRMIRSGVEIQGGDDAEDDADGAVPVGEGDEMDGEAFAKMMAESLGKLGLGGEGGEGMEGMMNPEMMQQFMMQMMQEMMSKEHIYDPIKDLATRLPAWLEENKGKIPDEDFEKHSKQLVCYNAIVAAFETEPHDIEVVQRNMIEVQTYGPPPRDLIPEEHREALDEMMAQAPASSQDDADTLRAMLEGAGKGGDAGCPQQ